MTALLKWIIRIGVIGLLLIALFEWRARTLLFQAIHDLTLPNPKVESKAQIDSVLQLLQQVTYQELPSEYQQYTEASQHPYYPKLQQATYYLIHIWDLNTRVVGGYRIRHFVCRDQYLRQVTSHWGQPTVWLIDKRILYKLLQLQQELHKQGHDPEGFQISSAHRHPRKNREVKAAKQSHHILGQAIDLHIKDINRDGRYTKDDKQIVLDLAENKVIKSDGGIGRYPGTNEVHLDVRGKRARWDAF